MNIYWESYPPVHISVASYLGIKPKSAPKKTENQDFAALIAQLPRTPK